MVCTAGKIWPKDNSVISYLADDGLVVILPSSWFIGIFYILCQILTVDLTNKTYVVCHKIYIIIALAKEVNNNTVFTSNKKIAHKSSCKIKWHSSWIEFVNSFLG